jgi:2-C-methyl-D-erythritol 4-phosphate cytidylyltransferase
MRAHQLAAADPDYAPTDDCGVVLRYLPEVPVHIVAGSERNLKVTYPSDLAVASALLSAC